MYLSSSFIKYQAEKAGFQQCGISKAEQLTKEAVRLQEWLTKGYHAGMAYMNNHFEKRIDPALLFNNAQSVISILLSYNPPATINSRLRISKYAYGYDYHWVVKEKMHRMIHSIRLEYPDFQAISYVDSAPVMDKAWAVKSGLGWIGKNGCLINATFGSFCFIGEIVCNATSKYDSETSKNCDTCVRCIEACPNKALEENYVLNANKCTSYHTIENKSKELPEYLCTKNYIFGCDICQNVCKYNEKALKNEQTPLLYPSEEFINFLKTNKITTINSSQFKRLTKNSALSRITYKQFMRNIEFAERKQNLFE